MVDYGVKSTGFVKKPLTVIRQEIKDDLLGTIASELNLLDSAVLGQIEGVFSDKLREMWDVCEAVYRAFYPDSASDEALDQVSSMTGVVRLPSTKSTVTLDRIWLDDGVTVTVGSIVSVGSTGPRFVTTVAVTNSTGAAATFSVAAESEDYGPIQGYAETIDTIQTPISGWSAAAAVSGTEYEPFTTIDTKTLILAVDEGADQTVTFSGGSLPAADVATAIKAQTIGIDAYDDGLGRVRVASDTEGPGSAIEIVGGTAATALGFAVELIKGINSEDADPGRNLETDPDLRLRREAALRSTGSATVEAIFAALILVADVEQVLVIENVEDFPVGGLPAKSFEAIILEGADSDIAETIWTEKPAGIKPVGNTLKVVTDSMGFDHDIRFSRPTEIRLHAKYELVVDPDLYPADGDDQVKAAAVAFAAALQIGEDVIALQFKAVPLDVAGVIDVTDFYIDTVDPPTRIVNISMTFRQLATLDTGDIDVVIP